MNNKLIGNIIIGFGLVLLVAYVIWTWESQQILADHEKYCNSIEKLVGHLEEYLHECTGGGEGN